jgi:N-acetylglutamate synthase-like GNAT family acetyltransferase
MELAIRTATTADIPALERLIEASVRGLQAQDYSSAQLDAALGAVFGVDRQLIADETYFIAQRQGRLVGCGGWSRRRTLFGADAVADRDDRLLSPGVDAARIRAFFVHPDEARQGVGAAILSACEAAAARAGFTELELGATLTGLPFYRRFGYAAAETRHAPLPGGDSLAIVAMRKIIRANPPAPAQGPA